MPPHLAHSVVSFQNSVGDKRYRELCEEAKRPENLPRVVEWMVERDSINSNRGTWPNIFGWLGDQCHFYPDREKEVKDAMSRHVVDHFEWETDILIIVVSGVCFHVSEWYLGYALHCMNCPDDIDEPTCPEPEKKKDED